MPVPREPVTTAARRVYEITIPPVKLKAPVSFGIFAGLTEAAENLVAGPFDLEMETSEESVILVGIPTAGADYVVFRAIEGDELPNLTIKRIDADAKG